MPEFQPPAGWLRGPEGLPICGVCGEPYDPSPDGFTTAGCPGCNPVAAVMAAAREQLRQQQRRFPLQLVQVHTRIFRSQIALTLVFAVLVVSNWMTGNRLISLFNVVGVLASTVMCRNVWQVRELWRQQLREIDQAPPTS